MAPSTSASTAVQHMYVPGQCAPVQFRAGCTAVHFAQHNFPAIACFDINVCQWARGKQELSEKLVTKLWVTLTIMLLQQNHTLSQALGSNYILPLLLGTRAQKMALPLRRFCGAGRHVTRRNDKR